MTYRTNSLLGILRIALRLAALAVTPALQAQSQPGQEAAERLAALKAAGPVAGITIYPVRVVGQPNRNVGDAVGLVLEKKGMPNLESAAGEFAPPADTAWEDVPVRFGEFLKQNPPKTAYALYAEYLGEPKTGPTEVRWLIADAAGQLVIGDRQTPKDADFKRTAGADPDPMGCSVLVAERVFSQLHWKKGHGAAEGEGKFARLWAEKSGTPSDAERDAMKQRAEKLKANLKSARIGVYATRVGDTSDTESAARLAKSITQKLGCEAVVLDKPMQVEIQPSGNQQKRLWDLARALRERVKAAPPETPYVLLADYYVDPAGGPAGGTHFVVCEQSGDWVIVDFQNNQWDDFKEISPKSVADCDRLTTKRLTNLLR